MSQELLECYLNNVLIVLFSIYINYAEGCRKGPGPVAIHSTTNSTYLISHFYKRATPPNIFIELEVVSMQA